MLSRADEIRIDRSEQRFPVETRFHFLVTRFPEHLIYQIPRMAGAQRLSQVFADDVNQFVDGVGLALQSTGAANGMEDGVELRLRHRSKVDLSLDPAQESLVSQRAWIQVRGKHHARLEWNLDLTSSGHGQVVDFAIERNNPAVQQLLRTKTLASKVVDDEEAVVGFHLHRSGVVLHHRIKLQLQHLDGQLAAYHDRRPLAEHPARIATV